MNNKLTSLLDVSIGKGEYGIGAPAVNKSNVLPTYLRITDINDDGTINFSGLKSVDADGYKKYLLEYGDVVFARTGNSTGRSYVYRPKDGNFVYAGFLIKFKLNISKVIPEYFRYTLLSSQYKNWIKGNVTGSTRSNINVEGFGKFTFKLPEISEQKRIADILTALDDKIELNNQMNQTLEKIASLLYKRWFVDFEFPDDKGNPYKSSGGEMVDSELGMIPKEWEVKELGEISEKIITGKTPSTKDSKNFGEGTPFITIPDMYRKVFTDKTVRHITNYGRKKIQNKVIPKNSVLVSCIATPGLVSITSKESITNQQINSIVCKKQDLYFIYETLLSLKEYIILLGSGGSTTLNLNKSDFSKISICYAENRINKVFYELCNYIFNQIYENQFEIIKLENIKEELLKELL